MAAEGSGPAGLGEVPTSPDVVVMGQEMNCGIAWSLTRLLSATQRFGAPRDKRLGQPCCSEESDPAAGLQPDECRR
jgi:hypothetical protein